VTQGVYSLLLKNGLHYKPSAEEISDILTAASSATASDADVELSKLNVHACVRARGGSRVRCALTFGFLQVVKDCENLRSSLKRHLRSADSLPTLWVAKRGLTVGGSGDQLPSFPGAADMALQVVTLRSLYLALPEHFRRNHNAMDADAVNWKARVGLSEQAGAKAAALARASA